MDSPKRISQSGRLQSMLPTYRGARVKCGPEVLPGQNVDYDRTALLTRNFCVTVEHSGVRKALRYLRTNFNRSIQVDHLADIAGLSRRGLHKAFLTHTGFPPGIILRSARLECACGFLADSDLPLRKITRLSGFRNANTFWVAFKRFTGLSPQQFRIQFGPARRSSPKALLLPN